MERQAVALGDLQKFLAGSPVVPAVAAVVLCGGASVVDSVADLLIR
jgi:hypothetical protein